MDEVSITSSKNLVRSELLGSFYSVLAEFLFILLPLIVLSVVLSLSPEVHHGFVESAEWSFGACVLFGQAIQRITAAASSSYGMYGTGKTALIVTLLLVMGLAPSVIVLALVILAEDCSSHLAWSQIGLFIVGSICFLLLGTMSHFSLTRGKG